MLKQVVENRKNISFLIDYVTKTKVKFSLNSAHSFMITLLMLIFRYNGYYFLTYLNLVRANKLTLVT